MHYNVSEIDSTTRYQYIFDDNSSCAFLVGKTGIIYIEIKQEVPFKELVNALNEVSNIISKEGITPTININNSTNFLKNLAKAAGFKKIPCRGISFSVWVKNWE